MISKLSAAILALSVVFSLSLRAQQIPAGGFENWTTTTYGDVPLGGTGMPWVTNDSFISVLGGFSTSKAIVKTTDANSGNYALCIQESYIHIPATGYTDSGGGVIFLGQVDFSTFRQYGVPYAARPVSVSGYYKMSGMLSGADTGRVSAVFRLGGFIMGEAIQFFYGNVNSYQPFNIPVRWTSSLAPDQLDFSMDCGGVDILCKDTSTRFFLDDVAFNFPSGVKENLFGNDGVQIFPNPATDNLFINLAPPLCLNGNQLTLHDVEGRQLISMNALDKQTVSLKEYPGGTYFLQLRDASGKVIYGKRIVVAH